jgi:hypothetical protein
MRAREWQQKSRAGVLCSWQWVRPCESVTLRPDWLVVRKVAAYPSFSPASRLVFPSPSPGLWQPATVRAV